MRIFTLGKNGIPLFFFALILFSGTFSSYGQECPTVEEPDQDYCYLSTIANLEDDISTEDIHLFRTATSTNPIPENELLETGAYYVGDLQGTCANRPVVNVTVNSLPLPTSSIGNFFQPCEYGTDDADVSTVEDLSSTFTATQNDFVIQVFNEEFTGEPLANVQLISGNNYFVGQFDPVTGCSSPRIAINYDPVLSVAPTGEAEQSFCNAPGSPVPTIADLEASGNNRWYSTATSNPALDPSTPLVDGETYFASQITNRNNSDLPPCESTDRFAVTVDLEYALISESQEFCGSIGTGDNFHAPMVSDLNPEGANWYEDEAFTQPLDPTVQLENGTVYYFDPVEEDCSVTGVTVTILDNPNAGRTSQETFCQNEGIINLWEYIQPSTVSGVADDNGSFNHPAFNGGTSFNTEDLEPGVYSLTYSVPGNGNCPGDTSSFQLTILDAPEAGTDITEAVCNVDPIALMAQFSSYLEGRDLNGTIDLNYTTEVETHDRNSIILALLNDYNLGRRNFPLTYNVVGTTSCSDSAQINLTVLDAPDAGTGGTIQLLADTPNTKTLAEALQGTPEDGGTWSGPNGTSPTGDLAPQEAGDYIYTVTSENGCISSSTVQVLAVQQDCPQVLDSTQEFCSSISTEDIEFKVPTISDLEPATATWYATVDSQVALAPDFALVNGGVYFAGNPAANCVDRNSVTVTILPKPNAGRTTHAYFCETEEAVNLVDYIAHSITGAPSRNGSFTPALEGNIFDPAAFGPGTYTFTYSVPGNEDCNGDTSSTTVTVLATPDAGVDVNEEFCINSDSDLPTAEEFAALYNDDSRDPSGTFNPPLAELLTAFTANPFGKFTTVYTVSTRYNTAEKSCADSATLTVTITEEVPADAGENVTADVCSTAGVQNLSDFLTEDAIAGGVFSAPYEDGTFDPSAAGAEPVVITYTVNEDVACVTGEATSTITLTVIEGPDAGEDGSITLNVADAPVNLFDSLGGTPDEGGTWAPGNANGELEPSTLAAGTYSYEYTVTSENECQDTAIVTVIIEGEVVCPEITEKTQTFCESILSGNDSRKPRVSDLLPAGATWYASATATEALASTTELIDGTKYFAGNSSGTCEARESVTVVLNDSPNAGATTSITFCESDEPVDLLTVLNSSIIGAPDSNGTFSPPLASGTTIFDPSVDTAGTYTYSVPSNGVCDSDTAVINISITPNANAGEEISLEFCATQEAADLTELLPEGVDTNGTFEGLEGNVFNPADFEVGSHEFNYTVTVTGACESTDTSVVTVVVTEAPAAPAAEAQSFCVVDGATVADLEAGAEGDNLLWYTDESLETLADEADALVAGTYYVTNTTEGGCESAAAAVVVTLTDATAPSLTAGGNVFCEFNNPTLATLTANVTGGNITWYDAATGGNALTSTQPLQNGVTYYAASTDATSACESSVRLAVTVDLGDCPVIIPDAFSPNGDGINDRFEISYIADEFPNYTIEIFNRWGNVVFKGNASTPNWDGVSTESRSLGDKVLPVGVYFYIVNYNDGQTAPTQGRLYLSR